MEPISLQGIIARQSNMEIAPEQQAPEFGKTGSSFADMLTDAVHDVDQAMKTADQNVQNLITGKTENVHDVMISMQRAQVSFQLMVEMRNKAIETYQEISRMPI